MVDPGDARSRRNHSILCNTRAGHDCYVTKVSHLFSPVGDVEFLMENVPSFSTVNFLEQACN